MKTKRILLGVTGGVAAYKSAELTRLLKKSGIDVQVVMTEAGAKFITPATMQALSGHPVFLDLWDDAIANGMAHIELSRGVDAILVAPASADFLAKLANGLANDLLSTLCLARQPTCRLMVAPAMNREMWDAPSTQRNIARLREDGVQVLGPDAGDQACGETGMGRMLEPEALLESVLTLYRAAPYAGCKALVTAGPTFEPIDPVRGITNSSSGKMGYAIARALAEGGADVTLVSGPTALAAPAGVKLVTVRTAADMLAAVQANLADVELFFAVAAVADYTPAQPKTQKIKKSVDATSLELRPTTDILAWVAAQPDAPFCVGFAAESENVLEYASKKRESKKIPLIVANLATSAIGADNNHVTLIDDQGLHELGEAPKPEVARQIVAHAFSLMNPPAATPSARPLKSIKHA